MILATNQPDVTYGMLSLENHKRIMADIEKLPLDDIFVCMHGRDGGCECKSQSQHVAPSCREMEY